jgi:hypothetical protein
VHGAIARVAVLMQIEREEVFVAGKLLFRHRLSFCPVGWAAPEEFYYGLRTNWF